LRSKYAYLLEDEDVKKRHVEEMWRWAVKTDDILFDPYPTVALIPYSPQLI